MKLLGNSTFRVRIAEDQKGGDRVFIQIYYTSPCSKEGVIKTWKGRKFYLSEHMLEQEVIFTVYLAFKLAVEHEVMESFKIDGITLVNPHVDYRELLRISNKEITRK